MSGEILQQILDELKEAREERQGMKTQLENMDSRLKNMEIRMNDMDVRMERMDSQMKDMNSRMTGMEIKMENRFDLLEASIAHMQEDITEIKVRVSRMEENEPKNTIAMLDNINSKLEDKGSDIGALN